MEKVEIGNCILYCGDSYDIIKEIETDSVSLVHMDPPYLIHSETANVDSNSSKATLVRGFWDKVAGADIVDGFNYDLFNELDRVLKSPNYQIWCSKNQFPDFLNMAIEKGYNWQDIMLYRNNPIPATNGKYLDKDYGIHMWSGRKLTGNYKDKDTGYRWSIGGNKEWNHPTMKPLKPTECLIRVGSDEGDLVLDPFMGSGTTGDACVRNNRRFIGIEKNPEFFKMAVRRITKIVDEKKSGDENMLF